MEKPLLRRFRRRSFFGFLHDQQMCDAFRFTQCCCRITQFRFQTTSRYTQYTHIHMYINIRINERFWMWVDFCIREFFFLRINNYLHSTHSWSNCEFLSYALNPANRTPRTTNRGRMYTCVLRWIDLPSRSKHFCSQALNRTAHKRPSALPCNIVSYNNELIFFHIWSFTENVDNYIFSICMTYFK